jgi:hypothetical protein
MSLLPHHWYFLILKSIVLIHIILAHQGYEFSKHYFFEFSDVLLRVSLGLYLGIKFWLFYTKTISFEDSLLVSISGFILLTDIKFAPLLMAYKTRDEAVTYAASYIPQ